MTTPLTWAEIDLSAIAHNTRALRAATHPGARMMAVVKADGYGHGAIPVAETALKNGADFLGVARVEEGIHLRRSGITAPPILIFGYITPDDAPAAIVHDLIVSVSSLEYAREAARCAGGGRLRVHLKLDTGMGRLGAMTFGDPERLAVVKREIAEILNLPGLSVEGVYTHFAASDTLDKTHARLQFSRFMDFLDDMGRAGMSFDLCHCCNSAGIMELPEAHLDMVRAGIALYGLYPSDEVDKSRIALKPAMTLKSRVLHVKRVPAGFTVSYGMTWTAHDSTTIATVGIGYADGLRRALSNKGEMLVRGLRAPIVGRVCMDLTMLDVGGIPGVSVGDEVVVFGRRETGAPTADEMAELLGTINYEVLPGLTDRPKRLYVGEGH